jgi:short-subunit dehydrogenase
LALVVNNAGFGGYRPFVTLDPKIADQLIDVHVRAMTQLTRRAVEAFVGRGQGAVINVASLLALSGTLPVNPMPARVVYGAAKSYMLTFTQLLAGELSGTGVRVQVCLPGVVATEFHTVQGMDLSHLPRMSAADVVKASLAALAKNEVVCVPTLEDGSLVDKVGEAQRAVFGASRGAELAPRYR